MTPVLRSLVIACSWSKSKREEAQLPDTYNELLCFLQQKSKVMVFEHLVAICTKFYSADEVKKAHSTLSKYVTQRLPIHKGGDKEKKTLMDMLKACLDPTVKLPVFSAVCIARLPPVGIDHVDIGALLQELTMLRDEVRAVSQLREEIGELRACMHSLTQHQRATAVNISSSEPMVSDAVKNLQVDMAKLRDNLQVFTAHQEIAEVSALSSGKFSAKNTHQTDRPPGGHSAHSAEPVNRSAAQVLEQAIQSGALTNKPHSFRSTMVIGRKTGSSLKAVHTCRTDDIFLLWLEPDTTDAKRFVCGEH